jgi:hypothetical protein
MRNFDRMTRRFGRSGARCLWLGVVATLLGGLAACGDGDGEDAPNGTGGASTGGKAPANGGAAGIGGSRVSGGSSGAAARAGSGGSSGALTGGAGGIAANAGEGGIPSEGGAGPVAGSPGGGSGGDAGSSTTAGSPNAGSPNAGESGAGGAGGSAELSVEYRGCEAGAAITRIGLYRIDREQQTCTLVVVQQGQINCLEGLKSEGWCVTGAAISSDIEACEAFLMPSDPVQATAGAGTFTVSTPPLTLDIDIDFEFPASSGFPETMSIEAEGCLADCAMNDCRP